jgi:hypothetical protein
VEVVGVVEVEVQMVAFLHYAGGAAVPYTSGQRSPARGLLPLSLPITAFAFFLASGSTAHSTLIPTIRHTSGLAMGVIKPPTLPVSVSSTVSADAMITQIAHFWRA